MRPWRATAHCAADELHEIDRASDVCVDDVSDLLEVLIEKCVPQSVPGIREERVDGPPSRGGPQLIHAIRRCQVRFDHRNLGAKTAETVGSGMNFRTISGDEQIKSFLRTDRAQFEPDTRRGACHDCKWFTHRILTLPRRSHDAAGFITTLMQESCLSRNVRYMAGASSSPMRCVMTNEGSISPRSMRSSSSGMYLCMCV